MRDPFLPFGIILALLVRWMVSRFPYSGAGKPPLYGDYEAQRHWMEITVNLEPKEWYKNSTLNDLQYWGLDYPPLTAYHMFLNGKIAQFYNPSWVKLNDSRGTHGYYHKLFMRSTVMFSDLFYIAAILIYWASVEVPVKPRDKALFATLSLLYPGLVLIDHGHFQYNCVSLAFTLIAIVSLEGGSSILGSLAFCLALNYKHMSLYHALPFFAYLLGTSLRQPSVKSSLKMLFPISVTVIATFYIIWMPFMGDLETSSQVIKRLFPFDRGLYEDKVANIWCATEVFLKLKQLFSIKTLSLISAFSTIACVLPSTIHLMRNPSFKAFKYSLVNSSLVFFLLSFQVHEKSILLVALPVITLLYENSLASFWFCLVSVFSLQPLLIKDVLMVPYYTLTVLFITAFVVVCKDFGLSRNGTWKEKLRTIGFVSSMMICLFLSLATNLIKPPSRYPDLFSVLNAIICCVHFVGFAIYFHSLQFSSKFLSPYRSQSRLNSGWIDYLKSPFNSNGNNNLTQLKKKVH